MLCKNRNIHSIQSITYLQKGDFVMEKKELSTPEKFIIWRIDAGKLIQKYESLILEDGTLVHKALSTVWMILKTRLSKQNKTEICGFNFYERQKSSK